MISKSKTFRQNQDTGMTNIMQTVHTLNFYLRIIYLCGYLPCMYTYIVGLCIVAKLSVLYMYTKYIHSILATITVYSYIFVYAIYLYMPLIIIIYIQLPVYGILDNKR